MYSTPVVLHSNKRRWQQIELELQQYSPNSRSSISSISNIGNVNNISREFSQLSQQQSSGSGSVNPSQKCYFCNDWLYSSESITSISASSLRRCHQSCLTIQQNKRVKHERKISLSAHKHKPDLSCYSVPMLESPPLLEREVNHVYKPIRNLAEMNRRAENLMHTTQSYYSDLNLVQDTQSNSHM